MQVCLPCGQAACCAHAVLLKRDKNCLSRSWLRQSPYHRRSPLPPSRPPSLPPPPPPPPSRSSGYPATAGPQLEARKRLDNVQAEFAKAGLSAAASDRVLKQCKVYLQWDCESKLQPALQLWLQGFGSEKLHEVLQYAPYLLERNPADCEEVFMWLLLRIPYTGRVYKDPHNRWHTSCFGVDAAPNTAQAA